MDRIYDVDIGNRKILIETGKLARQAGGGVLVRMGDSVILATACISGKPREGIDFVPLVVDYVEKTFAAGKIPGGFFKREGRPSELEVLVSRLIDRPIRPLLPKELRYETQIITTVLSMENDNSPAVMALVGASAALTISEVPFNGPIGAVRVGRIDGELVINPSVDDFQQCDINLIVAGTKDGITMVEGGAEEVPEEEVLDAIIFGWEAMQPVIDLQLQMKKDLAKKKVEIEVPEISADMVRSIESQCRSSLEEAFEIADKVERNGKVEEILESLKESFDEEVWEEKGPQIKSKFKDIEKDVVKKRLIEKGIRIDGRKSEEIRAIWGEVGILPRAHGSSIFTRGETQALVATTLGTAEDEQRVDALAGESSKRFILHYNFPPYSVGEVRFLRGPARREIGHGALAERALMNILPTEEEFPYTLRVVSEILESNGSSSMATVCGASMSLMDAGVPVRDAVGGIAMGLITAGENAYILSDILGDEDHLGDMDFKVAGTKKGVTAIQMDIKVSMVDREVLSRALEQACEGRLTILSRMEEVINRPRAEISKYAPRMEIFTIKQDKIRDVIGPGGKMIRSIIEETGVKIDIEDDGTVRVYSVDEESVKKAIDIINELTQEAEVGKAYDGKVKKITDFGAFVEIFPGTEGLVHISQISHKRINKVSDVLKEGDRVPVKVIGIDREGKIRLSMKELIPENGSSKDAETHKRKGPPRTRGPRK